MTDGFVDLLVQLRDAGAEFVIVGGVAAVLHGGSRVTFDLDLVSSLEPDLWRRSVDLLWSLGARPRIPETLERIHDVNQVRLWREEKGMLALNFRTLDGTVEVDLLVSEGDRFNELRERAVSVAFQGRTFLTARSSRMLRVPTRSSRERLLTAHGSRVTPHSCR